MREIVAFILMAIVYIILCARIDPVTTLLINTLIICNILFYKD